MDRLNRATLLERAPEEYHARVRLFMEFAGKSDVVDVPDPYYGALRTAPRHRVRVRCAGLRA